MIEQHEIIPFRDKSTNASIRRNGVKIGSHLAVARTEKYRDSYKIFRIRSGIPLLNAYFTDVDEAIEFAEWLDKQFGSYFDIWSKYPQADIFSLVKWTVPNGLSLYEMIRLLKDCKIIDLKKIQRVYAVAQEYVGDWQNE